MIYDFNASDFTPSMGGFEPLPAGDYGVVLAKAEERQNQSGTGSRTAINFQVIDGPHKGRFVPDNLHLGHKTSEVAYKAKCRLAVLCNAVEKPRIRGIMDLCNIPLTITVIVKEIKDLTPDPTGSRSPRLVNEVTNYKKYSPPQGGNPPQKPAPSGNPNNMPWG